MIPWQEHIAEAKKHVKALEDDGHIEREPACWLFYNQVDAAIQKLEIALKQKMKGK